MKAPCIVERTDEKFIAGGTGRHSFNFGYCPTAPDDGVIGRISALPAFTVVLNIGNK